MPTYLAAGNALGIKRNAALSPLPMAEFKPPFDADMALTTENRNMCVRTR